MVNILYDNIIASANEDIYISFVIKEEDGTPITTGEAAFNIYNTLGDIIPKEQFIAQFDEEREVWSITINSSTLGKFYYDVMVDGKSYCFKQIIEFI